MPVNPYSRRQAAVNQIISIPHGRKPVGQQTYLSMSASIVDKHRHTPYNQNQKQQARAPLLERPRSISSIVTLCLDVLHHILHAAVEQGT